MIRFLASILLAFQMQMPTALAQDPIPRKKDAIEEQVAYYAQHSQLSRLYTERISAVMICARDFIQDMRGGETESYGVHHARHYLERLAALKDDVNESIYQVIRLHIDCARERRLTDPTFANPKLSLMTQAEFDAAKLQALYRQLAVINALDVSEPMREILRGLANPNVSCKETHWRFIYEDTLNLKGFELFKVSSVDPKTQQVTEHFDLQKEIPRIPIVVGPVDFGKTQYCVWSDGRVDGTFVATFGLGPKNSFEVLSGMAKSLMRKN